MSTETNTSDSSESPVLRPIVVDLGKVKRKKVKQLKKGEGPLLAEVQDVINEVRSQSGDEMGDTGLLPVIVVYEKKDKKTGFSFFK